MCLTFLTPQSEQKESIIKISRSEQTDRNQVMIGRSHSGDRALMLLLVLRSFFPVPGNFTPLPVFWLLMSFTLVFSRKLPMKIQVLHGWFVIGRPSAGRGGDLWSRFTPLSPADMLTQRAAPPLLPHRLLHMQTGAGSHGLGAPAAQAVQESYLMRQTLRQAAGAPQPVS